MSIKDYISPAVLEQLADKAVAEVAKKKGLTGKRKHALATRIVVRGLDRLMVWPPTPLGIVAEIFDGPAASLAIALVRGAVQEAYQRHKRK